MIKLTVIALIVSMNATAQNGLQYTDYTVIRFYDMENVMKIYRKPGTDSIFTIKVFSGDTTWYHRFVLNPVAGFPAWADITGKPTTTAWLSNSTDKNFVTDAQSTVIGNTSGTNSGNDAANSTYANDYRAANFIAGTNYLAPAGNGSSLTGLTKSQVGLSNVDNTSDANKPVSSAAQTALDAKQATLVSATNIKTINGTTVLGSGNLVVSGGASRTFLPNDVVNNNVTANTIADVTALSFAVTANTTYRFKFFIVYTSAATTTGSRWSINGPATTFMAYNSNYTLTATSITNNQGVAAYNTPSGVSASSLAAGNICIIEGVIRPSANGTVIARFASEISSSAITAIASGRSYVEWEVIN